MVNLFTIHVHVHVHVNVIHVHAGNILQVHVHVRTQDTLLVFENLCFYDHVQSMLLGRYSVREYIANMSSAYNCVVTYTCTFALSLAK